VPAIPRFHLAITVNDLAAAREFYAGVLGCSVGRESERWMDFDFFGHQVTIHLVADGAEAVATISVDGKDIPVRHFGVILVWDAWQILSRRLEQAGVAFLIAPGIRFRNQPGEQATFFIQDPSENCLEFK